jgi:hypothetical protein
VSVPPSFHSATATTALMLLAILLTGNPQARTKNTALNKICLSAFMSVYKQVTTGVTGWQVVMTHITKKTATEIHGPNFGPQSVATSSEIRRRGPLEKNRSLKNGQVQTVTAVPALNCGLAYSLVNILIRVRFSGGARDLSEEFFLLGHFAM